MELKEKLKYVRLKLFMSQQEFARMLGVAHSTYNSWETGKRKPIYKSQKAFNEICEANKIKFNDEK